MTWIGFSEEDEDVLLHGRVELALPKMTMMNYFEDDFDEIFQI